jgi:hypothetical protein
MVLNLSPVLYHLVGLLMCLICVFFIDDLDNTDVDTPRIYYLWYKQFMLCTTLSEWSLGFRFLETIVVSTSEMPESSAVARRKLALLRRTLYVRVHLEHVLHHLPLQRRLGATCAPP